jgi:hypothetical protein
LSHDNRWAGRQGPVPRRPFPVPDALLQDSGRRRFTEFLMPASVILAGVLVVVAFGFIINRAMDHQDDNDAGQLPLPPPAFTVPSGDSSDDSSDQAVIPIPSEPSSASPSTTRPTEPPPTSRTRPPQEVVIERGAVPSLVNLSAEGDRDWVHWGQQNKFSLERDSDGDFQILEGAPKAPRFRHEKSPQRFSWRGGSPVESTDGVSSGNNTCDEGNGFTLSVPAASSTRVLRLYVGVQAARGRLEAKLSAGGDADTATLENRDGDLGTAVFTVTYRSSRDGKLNLSWITAESFSDDCGGVALEAATLR